MVERGPEIEPAHKQETILSRDFIDAIIQGARENLATHGSLTTTLFLCLDNGEQGIIPLSLPPTHEGKQRYFTFLGLSFLENGRQVQEAVLVSESWYVETTVGEISSETSPSQHPNRKEAITLVGRDALAQHFVFAIQPFSRDSQDCPVFAPLAQEQFEGHYDNSFYSTGLLDNLFPGVSIGHLC